MHDTYWFFLFFYLNIFAALAAAAAIFKKTVSKFTSLACGLLIFFPLIVAAAFRGEVGCDTQNYHEMFLNSGIEGGSNWRIEPFFHQLSKITYTLSFRVEGFHLIIAFLTGLTFLYGLAMVNRLWRPLAILWICSISYPFFFNTTRLGMATAFVFLASMAFFKNKQQYTAALLSMIATSVHLVAVFTMPFFFYKRRLFLIFLITMLSTVAMLSETEYLIRFFHSKMLMFDFMIDGTNQFIRTNTFPAVIYLVFIISLVKVAKANIWIFLMLISLFAGGTILPFVGRFLEPAIVVILAKIFSEKSPPQVNFYYLFLISNFGFISLLPLYWSKVISEASNLPRIYCPSIG